jgi:glutamine amidotransferase
VIDVTIIDSGIGNLGAIPNMLKRLGATATITNDRDQIARASRLILPGVGAFDTAMSSLRRSGLVEVLNERVLGAGMPTLGLCLGMQLLADESEEGVLPGLGWIPGRVVRFRLDGADRGLHVPQMGWNTVRIVRPAALLAYIGERPRVYFAHSYHFECDDPADVVAVTTHGYEFPSVIQRRNVMGAQFHPEKSHRFGLRLLANFARA